MTTGGPPTPSGPGGPPWPPPAQPFQPPGDDRPAWLREQLPPMAPVGGPPPPKRPRWPVLAAVLAVLLLVAGGGAALVSRGDRDPAQPAAGPGSTSAPSTTTPPTGASAIQARIKEIERRVELARELRFKRPVPSELLPNDKLEAKLLAEVDSETNASDLRSQTRALVLLGEVPAGTDLVKLLRDVQAESVLGFYVPGTGPDQGKLYVRADGGLTPFTEWVLSHELTHAVTDQHYDLTRADRLDDGGLDDELVAYTALVEGDATLLMQHYLLTQMDPAAQAAVAREGLAQTTPKLDKAPPVVRESLGFPYQTGLSFVQALYQRGGWEAVDKAYADPPTSTEQVLHPEKYLGTRDAPTPVSVPELSGRLGSGWRAGTDVGWGEFDTQLLLGGEVPTSTARQAATGWDGGRLRTFERGGATAMVLRTVWDSPAEASEYCRTAATWANGRLGQGAGLADGVGRWSGNGQQATLVCKGARAAWLSAPDAGTLARLRAGLGTP